MSCNILWNFKSIKILEKFLKACAFNHNAPEMSVADTTLVLLTVNVNHKKVVAIY